MRAIISVASLAVLVLGFSFSAMAEDGKRAKFEPARKAIEESGVRILDVSEGKDFRGKNALVLRTDMRSADLVDHFKTLYKSGKKINGARVVGLAHIVRDDSWNVTIRDGDVATTFKISKEKDGSRILVRKPLVAPIRGK
ncbi:MAG: hypothetical protein FJ109_09480 [Deltaproteobacteria bacterium]|nr:hypothetical protein [Deltaproteobacteria bacterium]